MQEPARRSHTPPRTTSRARPDPGPLNALTLATGGFMDWAWLRDAARVVGARAVADMIPPEPLLVTRWERPVDGRTSLLGRCALVRARAGGDVVTVGRIGADICLPLPTVSKRHLLLERRHGRWSVSDAGSSNGTRVAGKKVRWGETVALADGDIIGVADHVWLQLMLPDALLASLDPTTPPLTFTAHEPGASGCSRAAAPFEGSIMRTELHELLQLVELNRRTGELVVEAPTGDATVRVREGRIVDATFGRAVGPAAVDRLLALRAGTYRFVARAIEPTATTHAIAPLLMDAARRLDGVARAS
ncbi:MAG: DUF4388 domain-containing protein [Planctomycetes bacterium]|nr:DUF4388 domain-containing protein [Planctomycetota bacterium]